MTLAWPLLVALSLSAAPERLSLAMPGLRCVNVDEKSCAFFGDYFAEQLANGRPIRVSTQSEIGALLGFERQRQLLGCADSSNSCIAELAGGLGVEGLIVGNLAKFGDEYVISLKIVSARDGSPFGTDSRRVVGDRKLLDAMVTVANKLAKTLPLPKATVAKAPGTTVTAPPPAAPLVEETEVSGKPFLGGPAVWGTGAGGLVVAGVGAGLMVAAHGVREDLFKPVTRTQTELDDLIGRGSLYQGVGLGLIVTGAVAVAVAGGLWALDAGNPPEVAVSITPGGGWAVALGGTFP